MGLLRRATCASATASFQSICWAQERMRAGTQTETQAAATAVVAAAWRALWAAKPHNGGHFSFFALQHVLGYVLSCSVLLLVARWVL